MIPVSSCGPYRCYLLKNSLPLTVTEQVQSWLELMMILQILSRKKKKNISSNEAKTMAQHEISFMNFEPEFWETVCISEFQCDSH